MIIGENIEKKLGNRLILKNININLPENNISVVFGPSGSGKTTLLNCLSLIAPPDKGEINIFGEKYIFPENKKIKQYPYPAIGIVFQQLFLWPHLTNRDNILLAVNEKDNRVLQNFEYLVELLNMQDFINNYPNNSSVGEKQRIAIARALILNPKYLFFDEITASLDMVQVSNIVKIVKDLKEKNIGIFFITHQLDVAKAIGDNIYFLIDGEIKEHGGRDIFNTPKSIELKKYINSIEL